MVSSHGNTVLEGWTYCTHTGRYYVFVRLFHWHIINTLITGHYARFFFLFLYTTRSPSAFFYKHKNARNPTASQFCQVIGNPLFYGAFENTVVGMEKHSLCCIILNLLLLLLEEEQFKLSLTEFYPFVEGASCIRPGCPGARYWPWLIKRTDRVDRIFRKIRRQQSKSI